TDKIVPLMVAIYVCFALFIIFKNSHLIGDAFYQIFHGAFSPGAAKGGFVGVMIWGFRRACFSNEAGVGSASIAHSTSKTDRPVSEGIVSLLEPFIDTVVICTMTALVLVFTGFAENTQGLTGSALTNAAFSSQVSWFNWVLMICVFLFAFSTMISWSYYGLKAWTYLVGQGGGKEIVFKVFFLLCTVIGSSAGLGSVMDFSDSMILGMAFPNIIGLLIMSGEVRRDLKQYMKDLKNGVIKRYK
ncbi:MAG: alanine:cation symporter family protein, partial [Crocinitomicaceae bacterium]|nr:alanine:cation symporter family protein [Crocinitomicaceae bacterium]